MGAQIFTEDWMAPRDIKCTVAYAHQPVPKHHIIPPTSKQVHSAIYIITQSQGHCVQHSLH